MKPINCWLQSSGFRFWLVIILLVTVFACTEKIESPIVLELRAMPDTIEINDQFFYPKPFSIRAKYSDNTEKNITSRITWVSENLSLIKVNKRGEIVRTGDCLIYKCVVSLIATDPESGKSLRLTIKISQKKDRSSRDKVKENISHEQNDISESSEFEERSSDIDIDVINDESGVESIAFSSIEGALDVLSGGGVFSSKSKKSAVIIRKLMFEESDVLLVSGDDYFPQIIAIDNLGQRHSLHKQSVVCYAVDKFTLSVAVLPGCQLIAGKPGEAEVRVKFLNEQSVSVDTGSLIVRVMPVMINSSLERFDTNVVFSKNHVVQWFQVSGLQSLAYYRVLMSGNLSLGYRLSVYTRPATVYQACVNDVPIGSNRVACYFQTLQNSVTFAVENLGQEAAQFSLELEPAMRELFLSHEALNSQAPVHLTLGIPVSAFVFANKVGGNNRHHYVFVREDPFQEGLRVKLDGYSAQVALNISWATGFCNEKMIVYGNNEASCLIPNHVSGNININIDGNNGQSGVLNGQAAAFGGTFYNLTVSLSE